MTYQFLSAALHPIADSAKAFLSDEWGIPKGKVFTETEFAKGVPLPTLHAVDREQHIIAVEVSNRIYPPQIDALVLDCLREHLPVKLYVATPVKKSIDHTALERAKANGVGLLTVSDTGVCKLFERAVSLSLFGVRSRTSDFPKKYRQPMSDAHTTFVQGEPAKACLSVHMEIESLTRKICLKANKKGYWKKNAPNAPDAANPKIAFKTIAAFLAEHFDEKAAHAPGLNSYLLSQVEGLVGHRNDGPHKPNTVAKLKKRDEELRTRFEHAADTLFDLVNAAAPLRV